MSLFDKFLDVMRLNGDDDDDDYEFANEEYYDDAFYQLGMLYYDMGDLANAKKIFYGLRSEVPNSMYNNSKVQEILSK